jgi:hypothetical protein
MGTLSISAGSGAENYLIAPRILDKVLWRKPGNNNGTRQMMQTFHFCIFPGQGAKRQRVGNDGNVMDCEWLKTLRNKVNFLPSRFCQTQYESTASLLMLISESPWKAWDDNDYCVATGWWHHLSRKVRTEYLHFNIVADARKRNSGHQSDLSLREAKC